MLALSDIERSVASAGLVSRGALDLHASERAGPLADARSVLLLGMVGAAQWPAFAASAEARDGASHPLDRWSRRVVGELAAVFGAVALFPFEGPPYWPFQAWARRADAVSPSQIGMLIHREHGLWHSYRGALAFREAIVAPPVNADGSPCEACASKPCLSACPVSAFTSAGYDVDACAAHVRSREGADCRERGCLARRACPVGREYAHGPEQTRFHMQAFLAAR